MDEPETALVILSFLQADYKNANYRDELVSLEQEVIQGIDLNGCTRASLDDACLETDGSQSTGITFRLRGVELQRLGEVWVCLIWVKFMARLNTLMCPWVIFGFMISHLSVIFLVSLPFIQVQVQQLSSRLQKSWKTLQTSWNIVFWLRPHRTWGGTFWSPPLM